MRLRRTKRTWTPTGNTRIYWEQGGAVSLDGEQKTTITKTRWRTARWLDDHTYRRLLRQHVDAYRNRP